jgi:cytochrome c553
MKLIISLILALSAVLVYSMIDANLQTGRPSVNICTGECYQSYLAEQGTLVEQAVAKRAAAAELSPVELGRTLYVSCQACHGGSGEGGLGPQLAGQDSGSIADALRAYKNGETRGAQSALMWGTATALSDADIENLSIFVESL